MFDREANKYIDQVLEAAAKPEGEGIPIAQYGSSLFKMDGTKIVDTMHTAIFSFDGKKYHVSVWHHGAHPPEIKVEMERNIGTGELRPWRSY